MARDSAPKRALVETPKPASPLPRRLLVSAWIGLLVVLLVAAGWLGWLLVGTNQLAANQATDLRHQFVADCDSGLANDSAPDGSPIALVSIPAVGLEGWPVVVGSDSDALAGSVAWYRSSAFPGRAGNTVFFGYRITHGEPFADLLTLKVGDEVIVETCQARHHYRIVVPASEVTVGEEDDWVLDAVPSDPGRQPSAPMLTLVTTQDLLPTGDRSVAFAKLVQD